MQGTVGAEGVRYTVASLSILQPVVVQLYAADESDDLTLALYKNNWTEPRRTASTRGSGMAEFTFRTEGGLRIEVRGSSRATPYALVVWAGEEMRRPMRDVLTKNMLRDAISFGDAAASAAGGIAGLAWAKEKEKIRGSEEGFNQSYDAKYEELLATLKKNLLDIAACEEKIFDNPNWYERFGYFYHQFMAEAYRRPN